MYTKKDSWINEFVYLNEDSPDLRLENMILPLSLQWERQEGVAAVKKVFYLITETAHHCWSAGGSTECPEGTEWLSWAAQWRSCGSAPASLVRWPCEGTCGRRPVPLADAALRGEPGWAAAAAGCSLGMQKKHAGPPPPPCLVSVKSTGHCSHCSRVEGLCFAKGSPSDGKLDCTWLTKWHIKMWKMCIRIPTFP